MGVEHISRWCVVNLARACAADKAIRGPRFSHTMSLENVPTPGCEAPMTP